MTRALLGIVLWIASLAANGQAILELADDFAFQREAVEGFADRAYRTHLESLRREGRLDQDPALATRLAPLLARVAAAAALEVPESASIHWELHTCRACGESASAMAGGKLLIGEEFVARGLDDDEVGFVLGHEAGHVLAQHTREFATVARYFMDNGLHREYWDIQRELDASFIVQLRMAFVSARQEEEADRIGFIVGARAGFQPNAMLRLLGKLGDSASDSGFGSHPSGERRLEQAIAMLDTARALYGKRAAAK